MAWQVGVVIDSGTNIAGLLGLMPVWAWSTPERREALKANSEAYERMWYPEPALTLINTPIGGNPVEAILAEIPIIQDHHASLAAVHIVGLHESNALTAGMSGLGYNSCFTDEWGLLFSRPLSALGNVPELELNAMAWQTADDVYASFFDAVGAPAWHGRNFDALNDSIATGGINQFEVPYRIVILNCHRMNAQVSAFVRNFAELIRELQGRGCLSNFDLRDWLPIGSYCRSGRV
jgi:RNAse (barnase) inhibitor barstar